MTPKTALNADLVLAYMKTWRLWRLCWQHQQRCNDKLRTVTDPEAMDAAQKSAIQWIETGNRIWKQRSLLFEQLEAAGFNSTPN